MLAFKEFFCSWSCWWKNKSYQLLPQFSVNFQNLLNTCHLSSLPSLLEIGCKSGLKYQLGKWETLRIQRDEQILSRICPIGVWLPIYILADFKWFLCLKVKLKRFWGQKLAWTTVGCKSVTKVKQLASPPDITNTLHFRPPFMWLWTETSQLQTFTDFREFDGFT